MSRINKRKIIFVCASVHNSELVFENIEAPTEEEASNIFKIKYGFNPSKISGPFLKKKVQQVKINTNLKFDGNPQKAIFNGWLVNSFPLKEPSNSVFLIFIKKIDPDTKQNFKGTFIVQKNEIRLI